MTESEKNQLQNWVYWLESFCENRCFGRKGACDECIVMTIVKEMKERLEGSR